MADSPSNALRVWTKLQKVFSGAASTSSASVEPNLKQLNEMVYEVHCPLVEEKLELEIVFFHGLQLQSSKNAYFTTWMSEDNSQMWPQTWLVDAFPKSRILTVSYDAAAKKTDEVGQLDMFRTRENLLWELTSDSVHVGKAQCPIVLVGHCLGGLLLKELCLCASTTLVEKDPKMLGMQGVRDFFRHLKGMFFYGTPHMGVLLDDKRLDCLDGSLMEEIKILNASSARRNWKFCFLQSHYKWRTYGVGETMDTFVDCLGQKMRVVSEASSRQNMDVYYSANGNHYDICKPDKKHSASFTCLRDFLHQIHQDGALRSRVSAERCREYFVDSCGRVEKVKGMLLQPDAQTTFIVGLSGIGKTALAKQVFHDICDTFEVSCFVHLDNIGSQWASIEQVLEKVEAELKRLDPGWNFHPSSVPVYLKGRKVFIVLDNLQSQRQLDALDREMWLVGRSSRLVVTTTDSLLCSSSNTYELKYLEKRESRELFVHYAFLGSAIPKCLPDSLEEVIKKCEDFPLSLKILGSYLSKEDVCDEKLWKDLIVKLENAQEVASSHDSKLWARLRPCYDALTLSEQEMFLDVATLFCGWPLSFVEYLWSTCWLCPHSGWRNLKRGFMMDVDSASRICMPGLLKNLGRTIACPPNIPIEKWRRVYGEGHARKLIAKYQGFADTLSLELHAQRNERLLLRNTTFAQYDKLEFLLLEGVETNLGNVKLPSSLVWLRWKGGVFETCPVDFTILENLVALELLHCKDMKSLPPSVVTLKKLKWLELEGCQSLTKLPSGVYEFSELEYLGLSMTSLRKLSKRLRNLKKLRHFRADQTQLKEVPQSTGEIRNLGILDISNTAVTVLPDSIGNLMSLTNLSAGNTLLTSLPDTIGRLGMLEYLWIGGTTVGILPDSIGDLKSLTWLDADNTLLSSLPESIGRLQDLIGLLLKRTHVKCLPRSLGDLAKLRWLILDSTPLDTLPDSICKLGRLNSLYLGNTRITTLPDAIGELANLSSVKLQGSRVRSLPETFKKLSKLFCVDLTLSTITNDDEDLRSGALHTILGSNEDLRRSVDVKFIMEPDREVDAIENALVEDEGQTLVKNLTFPSQISPLSKSDRLRITGGSYQQSLLPALFYALQQFLHLKGLDLQCFNEVETIPSELGMLTRLQFLGIVSFRKLRELPDSLSSLKLYSLKLKDLPSLCRLPESFKPVRSGIILQIFNCGSLQSMPSSWGHRSLSQRDSSTLCDDECATSDSCPTLAHALKPGLKIDDIRIDSWTILRCLLECCNPTGYSITFYLKCGAMQRVTKMAAEERKGGGPVVATKLFREVCLECYAGDDGDHEIFRHSTSWPPLNNLEVVCENTRKFLSCACGHGWLQRSVRVMDIEEDNDGDTEEDSERDEVEEDVEEIEQNEDREDKERSG